MSIPNINILTSHYLSLKNAFMYKYKCLLIRLDDVINELLLPDSVIAEAEANDRSTLLADGVNEAHSKLEKMAEKEKKKKNIDPYALLAHLKDQHRLIAPPSSSSSSYKNSDIIELNQPFESSPSREISSENLNAALEILSSSSSSSLSDIKEMLSLMTSAKLAVSQETCTELMGLLVRKRKFVDAEEIFGRLLANGVVPNQQAWTYLVAAKANRGGKENALAALKLIEQIKKAGILPTTDMFTNVMKTMIDARMTDEAEKLWVDMHSESITLDNRAFRCALEICTRTGKAERAFFYMDEMRALKIEPELKTFNAFFRAVAEAPHWISGYQDIIFDAMNYMEGAEMMQETSTYNAIIHAFSRAGDPIAAEFYYWEMKKKGLQPDLVTYNTLLNALARGQSVGAKRYGYKGRYVRPAEKTPTRDQQAFMDIGVERANELRSQNVWQDTDHLERGSRQKTKLTDMSEEDPDFEESFMSQVREEAFIENVTRGKDLTLSAVPENYLQSLPTAMRRRLQDGRGFGSIDDRLQLMKAVSMAERGEDGEGEEGSDDDEIAEEVNMRALAKKDPELMKILKELDWEGEGDTESESESESNDGLCKNAKMEKMSAEELNALLVDSDDDDDKETEMASVSVPSSRLNSAERQIGERQLRKRRIRTAARNSINQRAKKDLEAAQLSRRRQIIKVEREKRQGQTEGNGVDEEQEEEEEEEEEEEMRDTIHYVNSKMDEFIDPFVENASEYITPGSLRSVEHQQGGGSTATPSVRSASSLLEALNLLDGDVPSDYKDTNLKGRDVMVTTKNEAEEEDEKALDKLGLGPITQADIDREWELIEFGRAPDPDYSMPLPYRRRNFVRKADKVFAALLREGFKPDAITLNTYMSTYAEAYKQDDALEIFDSFPKFGLVPDARSYRILIRMHIRCKNISAAMKAKEEAVKVLGDSYNDGEAYGLLIESWAHRRELVESLKLLEEATDKNIRIHERFIRNLRAQCEKLGVVHPNMPPNSRQWIKNLKEERRKSAKANQRRIEPIRSALFTTK